jgi:aldehyde:ferredoxin oxidoreductase
MFRGDYALLTSLGILISFNLLFSLKKAMYGYNGRILRVNLSTGKISVEPLSEAHAAKYLGGRGLVAKILFDEVEAGIDPLSPDNKIVYATGPFAATGFPLNSRWIVAAKSPLTGIWGEATCGGSFAIQLKKAGYDVLIVEGVAESPVYISILDADVEIKDASILWKKMTLETEIAIAHELGLKERKEDKPSVVCIGPAGEKLVKIAAIMHTAHRAAGRTGLGAVMGSKKLKAIAVDGTKKIAVANPTMLHQLVKNVIAECKSDQTLVWFSRYGQAGFVDVLQEMGMLPTKNFQQGTFKHFEEINGKAMAGTILKRKNTCSQCPVFCKREIEVKEGLYAPLNSDYGGPEYESIASLGSLLLISDLKAISKANYLCNAYGIDTISTGVIIAWLMECYERGIVSKQDVDGIEISWGNVDAALKLIEKIAKREGIGDLLAEGIKKAAKTIGRGSERYAMEVKGLEVPLHEPRAKKGLGLSYATSIRGACHMQAFHDTDVEKEDVAPEIGISKALDRHSTTREKSDMIKRSQDWVAVTNSLLICTSPGWIGFKYTRPLFLADALNAITGLNLTVSDLMIIGERANNLCRCFNAREGMTRKDDYLPLRFTEEPLPDGLSKGQCISKDVLSNMLDDYYELRGWDSKTGNPTKEKLEELDLDFV